MDESAIDTAVSLLPKEIKSLKDYCLKVVAEKVTEIHLGIYLKSLTESQRDVLAGLLPLELPLVATLPTVLDDTYWKRKCIDRGWNYVHFWISGCSWREAFAGQYAEEATDEFLAKRKTFGETAEDTEALAATLRRLKVNGYKANVAEDEGGSTPRLTFEEDAARLFSLFPNLEEVYLNIAPSEYAVRIEEDGKVMGQRLIEDIFSLKGLTRLSIIGFSLTESQIAILCDHLLESAVDHLNLACNLLSDDCCLGLARVLELPRLQTLVLSNNCIGCGGVGKLLSRMRDNKTLVSLDLSKNYIGDTGGVALAEVLKGNATLRKLDVSFNKLGLESGRVFEAVVRCNSGLLCLNLSGNALGKEVGKMFAAAIGVNRSLRYFGIEFCGFAHQEEDVIYTIIHRHRNGNNESDIFL